MSDTKTINRTDLRFKVLKAVEAREVTIIAYALMISSHAKRAFDMLRDAGFVTEITAGEPSDLTEAGKDLLASWRQS